MLAAGHLQPFAVDVSCEVLGNIDEPSPDSLSAQLGMDYERGDASQRAYGVKERDRMEAEKSGKILPVAENPIWRHFRHPDAIHRGVTDRRELVDDECGLD